MALDDLLRDFAKNLNDKLQEEKRKDVSAANQHAGLVDQHLQSLAKQEAALRAAKESMNPASIREAANGLESIHVRLLMTRDWLRRGIAQAPENVAELQAAETRASEPLERIAAEVAHARGQAARLANVQGGALAELPHAPLPASPEETRKVAAEVAPLGLCDDPAMESPDSVACPLSDKQREASRDYVTESITLIADQWRDAATSEELRVRLEPLFRKSGLNPLVDLLISVATGWLAAQVGNLFLKSVNSARNALTRRGDSELTEITGLPGPFGGAPDLGKQSGAMVSGFGSSLATKALGTFKTNEPIDNTQVAFDGIKSAASAWRKQAKLETRQLPDPVLVGLAESLGSVEFGAAYFRTRIERLIERFYHIEKIGQVTLRDTQPLQPIWVLSHTRGSRLALARRDTVMVPIPAHPSSSREPGDEERERATGQWIFDSWVDRSLYSVALAHEASPPTMPEYDSRWISSPAQAVDPGDVHMLGPDRKEPNTP